MVIGILEPNSFSKECLKDLKKKMKVNIFSGNDFSTFLKPINVLFIALKYKIDEKFLKMCPNLKVICSSTTGLNHIDVEYLKNKNIKLISLQQETSFLKNIRATPEHTFGLILALLRNYKFAFHQNAPKKWERESLLGQELFEKKVGIIGMGRVGHQTGKFCKVFGADVGWFDIRNLNISKKFKRFNSIENLITWSDIVVLAASFRREQGIIISKKEIKLMSKKYFINTARGELIDEIELIEYIKKNQFLGVALDVIFDEKNKRNLKNFLKIDKNINFILTPHIGGLTKESRQKTDLFIIEKFLKNCKEMNI